MNQAVASLQTLNESQKQIYLSSLEELSEHAEDIAFRAYDLLFSRYPVLKALLSEDRFTHPDLACLLSNEQQGIKRGVRTLECLVDLTSNLPRIKKNQLIPQIRKCLIQSVRDIMFIEASKELVGIYSKLLDHRLRNTQLIPLNRSRRFQ